MVLFWVLIVLGIVWLARGAPTGLPTATRRETPLEVLDRRFAAGEIEVDEYREWREVLVSGARQS